MGTGDVSRRRAAVILSLALGLASVAGPGVVSATGTGTAHVTTFVRNNVDVNDTTISFGTPFHDLVIVGGSLGTPSGNVVIRLYAGGTCGGTADQVSSALALSSGVLDAKTFAFIRPAGAWSFRVHYQGNATYAPTTGACEPFTVLKAIPLVTTEIRNAADHAISGPVVVGSTVHDFIHVSSAAGTATGTVTVKVYTDGSCSTLANTSAATSLVSGSLDFIQFPFKPDHPGGFSFRATYNGNSQTQKATGQCEPFTAKAVPALISAFRTGFKIVTSAPEGTAVNFATEVLGNFGTPTGTVTISAWENGTCSGSPAGPGFSLPLSGGFAILPNFVVADSLVTIAMRATYTGNSAYFGRTGACKSLTITKAIPNLVANLVDATGHAVSSVPIGSPVHVAATVSGLVGTPTGEVLVAPDATGCPGLFAATYFLTLVSGVADGSAQAQSFATTGTRTYAVWYGGDSQYEAAKMQCIALAVTAPGSTPKPAPTAAAPATAAPGSSGSASSPAPSGSGEASSSPVASTAASETASQPASASTPAASSAGAGSAAASTDSSSIWLLIGAIVLIAIVIGVVAARSRRRSPTPPG